MDLNLNQFNVLQHNKIFKQGVAANDPDIINIPDSETCFKYVCKKGTIDDWAMYIGKCSESFEHIVLYGSKLYIKPLIEKITGFSPEVINLYRY